MLQALEHMIEKTFIGIAHNKEGYKPRESQQLMVNQIGKMLNNPSNNLITIEGQTGCGKSMAYLVPAINQVLLHNKNNKERIHLVVATANVALQQQLINHELPVLAQAGLKMTSVLAAGRGRYLCQKNAMVTMEDENLDVREAQKLEELLMSLGNNSWDGLKDNLTDDNPLQERIWPKISAQRAKCKDCEYKEKCAFVKARSAIEKSDVIVANHALVWSDLEDNKILPLPQNTIYVFDEAHHIPKSYRDSLSKSSNLNRILRLVNKDIDNTAKIINQLSSSADNIATLNYQNAFKLCSALKNGFNELESQCVELIKTSQQASNLKEVTVQFSETGIPAKMRYLLNIQIAPAMLQMMQILEKTNEWGSKQKSLSESVESQLKQGMSILGSFNNAFKTFNLFTTESCEQQPMAQWICNEEHNHSNVIFQAGLVYIGHLLKEKLFDKAYGTCLVSATLRSLGTFDRFLYQVGIQKNETQLLCIESPFDYQHRATLSMNKTMPIPDYKNEALHTQSIVEKFKQDFDNHQSGVMLFSSRRQMNAFVELLDDETLSFVKLQYTDSRKSLIDKHKLAVDSGKKSCLIGCQSLSEGMDLPRQYLTYVGIAKIPFSDISNPMDNAEAIHCKRMRGNPFRDIMLPDASARLVQSTGRLMRTVECSGQIAIYDSRLINKPYGNLLLNTLPSFNRQVS